MEVYFKATKTKATTTETFINEYTLQFTVISEMKDNHESDRLAGLVVKASASRAEDPGFESRLRRDISGSNHTSDLKIGTPVTTLPGAWRYRVSTGSG